SVRARDLYEPLAPALRETTGIEIGFWRSGIAAVAFEEAGATRLKDEVARQRQAGLRCDWLEADEVRERWPGAAPECHGALFAPEDGALDPQGLTRACLADARRLGAALHAEPVESIQLAQGRVTGVVAAGGTTSVEHAVLAAGVWSPRIRGLPRTLPVEPLRGQMAATAWPDGNPPSILYHDQGYVLARAGAALLGSTMERAGYDARVTNEGLAQVFRGAVRLLPALLTEAVQRVWAGLRPATSDGRPILGVGRRLAFDEWKGRLWVICPRCSRWNLAPLDDRLERIEALARAAGDGRVVAATDQVALIRWRGYDLIRVGKPRRLELATWRYGERLRARRQEQLKFVVPMTV